MSINPEIALPPSSERFNATDLMPLDLLVNDIAGRMSYYASDGAEFLDFDATARKVTDYGESIWTPSLYVETASPYDSPVPKLDHQMVTHWVPRTTQFESKTAPDDKLALKAITSAVEFSQDSDYMEDVKSIASLIDLKIHIKKLHQTQALLNEMNRRFIELREREVWLIAHVDEWSRTVAGKLVGFTLVGEGDQMVVEAIVENESGIHGLLPEGSSVVPASYLKDDGLVRSLSETIFPL